MDSEKQMPENNAHSRDADMYDLLAWLEVNKMKVAAVAVVAVIIGFIVAVYRYTAEQKEVNASSALMALKPSLIPSTNTPPAQASAYFKVADEFSGTSAAERAQFLGATALFDQGKYSEAEAQFGRFLKDRGDSPWAAEAAYGLAASQEAQGKTDAIASYQNVFTKWPQSSVAGQAELAVARIYEQKGQPEQALGIYNRLSGSANGTAMLNPEILQKKEALLRRHPSLSTNSPVITPAMQATGLKPMTNAMSAGATNHSAAASAALGTNTPVAH